MRLSVEKSNANPSAPQMGFGMRILQQLKVRAAVLVTPLSAASATLKVQRTACVKMPCAGR
jgi:hypothetical protein